MRAGGDRCGFIKFEDHFHEFLLLSKSGSQREWGITDIRSDSLFLNSINSD